MEEALGEGEVKYSMLEQLVNSKNQTEGYAAEA